MDKERLKEHVEVNVELLVNVELTFHEPGNLTTSTIGYDDFRSVREEGGKTIISYWTNDDDYPIEAFVVTETVEEVKEILETARKMLRNAHKDYKIVRVKWSK